VNTSVVAAAFLSMRGVSENVSKPQPTEPDERGDLYRFGSESESRSWRAGAECGEERVAGVKTVVRERHEEDVELRSETKKRGERERVVDGTRSGTKQRERMWRKREKEREKEGR